MNWLSRKAIKIFESRASEYIMNKGKVGRLINIALHKANKVSLKEGKGKLHLLAALLKDWARGEYKDLSKKTLIILIGAILYFVSPIDLVSDFIPFAGILDDITIFGYAYTRLSRELERYQEWKKNINNPEIIDVELEEHDIS